MHHGNAYFLNHLYQKSRSRCFILTGQLAPPEHNVLFTFRESERMLSARLNICSAKICVVLLFNKSLEVTKVLLPFNNSCFRLWRLSRSVMLRLPFYGGSTSNRKMLTIRTFILVRRWNRTREDRNTLVGRAQQTWVERLNSLCVNAPLVLWHNLIK